MQSFFVNTDLSNSSQTYGLIKWILVVSNINFLLTPWTWHYLADHDFAPQWLNELFGVMLVAFIIAFIFWAANTVWHIRKAFWILPLALVCAVISLWIVVKPVNCVFDANLPKFTHRELRYEHGWPFAEFACNDKPSNNVFGTFLNTLYWTAMVTSLVETIKKFRRPISLPN